MGCAAVLIGYYYFTQDLPRVEALKNYRPKTVTYIYSDDGRVIGEYSHERRIVVPLAKIPEHVRHAFIAAEDANFYHHPGIDLVSIFRAFVKNIEAGKTVQGRQHHHPAGHQVLSFKFGKELRSKKSGKPSWPTASKTT